MELECSAIVLSARRHGEGGAIVHLFSDALGRVSGFVHGGLSRRHAAIWQPGNLISCQLASRTSTQLAQIRGESVLETASYLMDRPIGLNMAHSLAALLDKALPEGEAHPEFYADTVSTLVALTRGTPSHPVAVYIKWEVILLQTAGFGLDLNACAVTGRRDNLAYVSPSSGRAVSAEGAGKWRDRLLPLPAFLLPQATDSGRQAISAQDARDGARLTHYFLGHHVFGSRHLPLPTPRIHLQDRLERAFDASSDHVNQPDD